MYTRQQVDQMVMDIRDEIQAIITLQSEVEKANSVPDLLARLQQFQKWQCGDQDIDVASFKACPSEYTDWMFNLLVQNMRDVWDQSYPWDEVEKRAALFDRDSNYIIAFADSDPIGFLHFKFEQQEGRFVIFIHDSQVEKQYQDSGLKQRLVRTAEWIGLELGVHALMTMVYKADKDALEFFRQCKFIEHDSSPDKLAEQFKEQHRHDILVKPLRRRL